VLLICKVDVRWRPGEDTTAGLVAEVLVVLSPSVRHGLRGLPGWPEAPVTHRAPMWAQRAHGTVLFGGRRHRTRFALHWSQAERLNDAALCVLPSIVLIARGGTRKEGVSTRRGSAGHRAYVTRERRRGCDTSGTGLPCVSLGNTCLVIRMRHAAMLVRLEKAEQANASRC
jgi:hypothetical protein